MTVKKFETNTIHLGDCVEVMASWPDNCIDAIVTDPPYGLEFMGKEWDKLGKSIVLSDPSVVGGFQDGKGGNPYSRSRIRYGNDGQAMQEWHIIWAKEAIRVLKPGGHALVMGGTRTFHRLTCALEDAGFEIKDCLSYNYAQGFPKSTNIAKQIDKGWGFSSVNRSIFLDSTKDLDNTKQSVRYKKCVDCGKMLFAPDPCSCDWRKSKPKTIEAQQWEGWGSAIKPAWEPIVLCKKPISERNIAENVLKWGTGGLNIDGCRLTARGIGQKQGEYSGGSQVPARQKMQDNPASLGRFPANFLLSHHDDCELIGTRTIEGRVINRWDDGSKPFGGGAGHPFSSEKQEDDVVETWNCHPDCPIKLLDEQSGERPSSGIFRPVDHHPTGENRNTSFGGKGTPATMYNDSGGASRFFFTSKASPNERNLGMSEGETNKHPTVKPIALMRYLCRLVTPPKGIILDPFTGSGTTAIAAVLEGFNFVGIEKEEVSWEMAMKRLIGVYDLLAGGKLKLDGFKLKIVK